MDLNVKKKPQQVSLDFWERIILNTFNNPHSFGAACRPINRAKLASNLRTKEPAKRVGVSSFAEEDVA
jgi:hypothetical protein